MFDEIRQLFDRQFERLSEREQMVMYWLTIERELVSWQDLQAEIIPPIANVELLDTLKSLGRRCLIEQSRGKFTQQAAIVEYVTERMIDRICQELGAWHGCERLARTPLWWNHPLLKAQSPEHIRMSQRLQILQPIGERLILQFGSIDNLVARLRDIIASLQATDLELANYGGGNLFNLLQHLQVDLSGYDFSRLALWQTDLQGTTLHNVNFTDADLSQSLFTKTFGRAYAIALSPDGQTLATSDDSGVIWLWRISDRQPIGKLVGHTNFAWSLIFIPDHQILISAGQDGKIGIWDLTTQENRFWLQVDNLPVHSVAYLQIQGLLASGHGNGVVRLWSLHTGLEIAAWITHDEMVYTLPMQFSPDGSTLATGSRNGMIEIRNTIDWQLVTTLVASPDQFFYNLAFSYDGRLLVGGGNNELIVWDVATGEIRHRLQGHQNRLVSLAASPNCQLLASGGVDSTIKIWNLMTGQLIKTIADHQDWIWSLQFTPTGDFLISSCADQSVRFWDLTTWKCAQVWKGYNNYIWGLAFNADGSKLATGSQDGCVRIWDVATQQIIRTLRHPDRPSDVWAVDWHGETIVSSDGNGSVSVWNALSGELLQTFAAHRATAWATKFNPDGTLLATAGLDSTLCFRSMPTGRLMTEPIAIDSIIRSLCFSPDGRFLATASFDGCWRMWEVATATLIGCYTGHTSWLWSIDYSPDGRWIATGSSDRTVKLWDATTGDLIYSFTNHTNEVSSVKFTPDNHYLAGGSNMGEVYIWELATLQLTHTCHGFEGGLICFSPDGKWLANGWNTVRFKDWFAEADGCIFQVKPPYDQLNITDVKGLTDATISTLKTLGAIDGADANNINSCQLVAGLTSRVNLPESV